MFGCDHDDRIFMIGPSWGWDMPQLPVFVKTFHNKIKIFSFGYLQSSKVWEELNEIALGHDFKSVDPKFIIHCLDSTEDRGTIW